jgi:hypothetical protein
MNVVLSKQETVERLKRAVEDRHQCSAVHARTVPVHEQVDGQTVWQGEVEVFDITGHPQARHCYAWIEKNAAGDHSSERVFAVLDAPPVDSPQAAVAANLTAETPGSNTSSA